ncbi:MAG: hypothetical protein AAF941_05060 [Pseudomonadota bacterium]
MLHKTLLLSLCVLLFACEQADDSVTIPNNTSEAGPDAIAHCDPVSASISVRDCDAIKQQIANLVGGDAELIAPDEMYRGDTRKVLLDISPTDTSDTIDIEDGDTSDASPGDQVAGFAVKIGRIMEARLSGSGVRIVPTVPEQQDLGASRVARWEWDVTAEEQGTHQLYITVQVKALTADGEITRVDLFNDDKEIAIRVKTADRVSDAVALVGRQFQTLEGALVSLAALLLAVASVAAAARKVFRRDKPKAALGAEDEQASDPS